MIKKEIILTIQLSDMVKELLEKDSARADKFTEILFKEASLIFDSVVYLKKLYKRKMITDEVNIGIHLIQKDKGDDVFLHLVFVLNISALNIVSQIFWLPTFRLGQEFFIKNERDNIEFLTKKTVERLVAKTLEDVCPECLSDKKASQVEKSRC